jgi:heat shock protein HtpX
MTTYDFITSNKRRSVLLITVFLAVVIGLGLLIDSYFEAGGLITLIAVGYAIFTSLIGYYNGDKVALWSSGAKAVDVQSEPYVVRMVENLCIATGSPMPNVYVIEDSAINAFATGRDPQHSSIAVTRGAIEKLENEELEGVLAHELSHIRNYDIRVMTLVIVLVGTVAIMSDMFLRLTIFGGRRRDSDRGGHPALLIIGIALIILSPIIAKLIQLAVSRQREYLADSSAALITRFPEGLARALQKIQADHQPMQRQSTATAHLYIANPLAGRRMAALFSTHPPVEKRIEALRKMSNLH